MNEIVNEKLTGNYYFSKKILGGFDVMVEASFEVKDPQGEISPRITAYKKATEKDLVEVFYKKK
jgi:hypothetical protein